MTTHSIPHDIIQDLGTRLTSGATATETLLAWCEEHGLSQGPITAEVRQRFSPTVVPDNVLTTLEPAPGTTIHYRQVQLMRGTLHLATAENWFVPQRLTAAMNDRLQTKHVPFGTVIAPLNPFRRTLAVRSAPFTSGSPITPARLEGSSRDPHPEIILEHTAVILGSSGAALAFVREWFRSDLVSLVPKVSAPKRAAERQA
jgi:hypothetical protein